VREEFGGWLPGPTIRLNALSILLLTALVLPAFVSAQSSSYKGSYKGYAYLGEAEGGGFIIDSFVSLERCNNGRNDTLLEDADRVRSKPLRLSKCAPGTFYLQSVKNGRPVHLNVLIFNDTPFLMQAQDTLDGCRRVVALNSESAKRAGDTSTRQTGCQRAWFVWD
jgi:hypothetical protein